MAYYTLKGKLQAILDSLGTPAGADLSADIAAIKTLVDSLDVASIQAVVTAIEGTDFSSTTDSLKILSDVIDAVKAKTDNLPVSPCATADVANALVDVKHKDIGATFDPSTDSLEAISDKLGVLTNTGGVATLTGILGDFYGYPLVSYVDDIVKVVGQPKRKDVTFSNTNTDVNLFTVTGAVRVKITAICTTSLASAGGCTLTLKAGTTELIPATASTDLVAGELWFDATPTETVVAVATSTLEFNIGDGGDIVLDVETAKQVDSGAMTFYLEATPLITGATVVTA